MNSQPQPEAGPPHFTAKWLGVCLNLIFECLRFHISKVEGMWEAESSENIHDPW